LGLFNFFNKAEDFFSAPEKEYILEAIRNAEQRTSGEVRVFIESKCRFVNPIDRAVEIFYSLQMEKTALRNGVLVYVATKDRQLAIWGDEGIHQKVGSEFWNAEVKKMLTQFSARHYSDGIAQIVSDIGEALTTHFPYDSRTDKNELPDNIVFGR
jgi:uncharacterized membrane protein